jgi:hypothetical protein
MQTTIMEAKRVNLDIWDQMLITYFAIAEYLRENGNMMGDYVIYL